MFLGRNSFIHPASVLMNQSIWANKTAQFCQCWMCFYWQHVQSHSILSSDLLEILIFQISEEILKAVKQAALSWSLVGVWRHWVHVAGAAAHWGRNPDLGSAGSSPLHLPKTGTCGPGFPNDWVSASVCPGSSGKNPSPAQFLPSRGSAPALLWKSPRRQMWIEVQFDSQICCNCKSLPFSS